MNFAEADSFSAGRKRQAAANPRGGPEAVSYDPCQPPIRIARKVIKGGSHLCAPTAVATDRPRANRSRLIRP
jgi:sulfatase modifying factor 1